MHGREDDRLFTMKTAVIVVYANAVYCGVLPRGKWANLDPAEKGPSPRGGVCVCLT